MFYFLITLGFAQRILSNRIQTKRYHEIKQLIKAQHIDGMGAMDLPLYARRLP